MLFKLDFSVFQSRKNLKYLALLTILLCALLKSAPSFALGQLGHQLVCQLAFDHLPQVKQSEITRLLQSLPEKHKKLINKYTHQKKSAQVTFANACTWADAIKRQKLYKPFKSWHYMNIPRNQDKVTVNTCTTNCIPQAIVIHQKELSTETDTWKKAQAMMFLGHWLGDIHQPLHVSFASDYGGNKIKFASNKNIKGKCNNLHWLWDTCLLQPNKKNYNETKAKWLQRLNNQWQSIKTPAWKNEQVWQWADESYQIATKPSFLYCVKQTNSPSSQQGSCEPPKNYKVKLPDNYVELHQPIIEMRLLQAAKRLTKVLEVSL